MKILFLKLYWFFLSFSVKTYVKEEIGFWSEADTNEIAKSWLKFCNIQKNFVKVMEYDVPEWICPKNTKLALSDIKVSSYFSFNFQISFYHLCINFSLFKYLSHLVEYIDIKVEIIGSI